MVAYKPDNPIFTSHELDRLYEELEPTSDDRFILSVPLLDDVIQINKHRTDGYGYLDILRFDGGMVVKRYDEEAHHDISVDINLEPDLFTGEDNPKKVSVFNRPVSELVFFQHPNGWQVNTDGPTVERRSRIEKFAEILGSYGVNSLIKRGRSLRSSFFE